MRAAFQSRARIFFGRDVHQLWLGVGGRLWRGRDSMGDDALETGSGGDLGLLAVSAVYADVDVSVASALDLFGSEVGSGAVIGSRLV